MNHPTREEWMSYLYDELNVAQRGELAAHLRACPECAARVKEWQVARNDLDAWRLPRQQARIAPARGVLRWAAAAAVVLVLGFAVGRVTSRPLDVEQVRAAIEPELRRQLQQEVVQLFREGLSQAASATLAASGEQTKAVLADFARTLAANRIEDQDAVATALAKLQSQHLADYLALKKELDTVAVNTDTGLRQTEAQLIELADARRPGGSPDTGSK